jgi:hypothetical protein
MNTRPAPSLLRTAAVALALAFAASTCVAFAATPPPKLIKLPNGDYTVPMSELDGSGVTGVATFHPQGMKTLVTVQTYGIGKRLHEYDLHPGTSCSQLGVANAKNLRPALTGIPSQTLVSLPIDQISSHYVIASSDATENARRHEACGHF